MLFTEKSPAVNKEFHCISRINFIRGEDHAQAARVGRRLRVSYAADATGQDDREKKTMSTFVVLSMVADKSRKHCDSVMILSPR